MRDEQSMSFRRLILDLLFHCDFQDNVTKERFTIFDLLKEYEVYCVFAVNSCTDFILYNTET